MSSCHQKLRDIVALVTGTGTETVWTLPPNAGVNEMNKQVFR